MITGDNITIGKEIGHRLGLNEGAIRAYNIEGKGRNQLLEMSEALSFSIYQRLYPYVLPKAAQQFAEEVDGSMLSIYGFMP